MSSEPGFGKWIQAYSVLFNPFFFVLKFGFLIQRFAQTTYTSICDSVHRDYPYAYMNIKTGSKMVVDTASSIKKGFMMIIYGINYEPTDSTWINSSQLTEINNEIFTFREKYRIFEPTTKDELKLSACQLKSETVLRSSIFSLNENLITIKSDNLYWYYVTDPTNIGTITVDIPISNVRFISIQYIYTRNGVEHACYLELPNTIYLAGNQILSAVFIFRYFKYAAETSSMVSDMFVHDYYLRVIDNNINTFELRMGQYCVLSKNDYTIVDIGKPKKQ